MRLRIKCGRVVFLILQGRVFILYIYTNSHELFADKKKPMKKLLLLFLFLISLFAEAQPGPYTGVLNFKVYHKGKMVDLTDTKWKIIPTNITLQEKAKPYSYPDYYTLTPKGTPMGGTVKEDFYLDIIFKKDTMKIYTPDFSSSNVTLDSIPFRKGTFRIPQHIYDLREQTKFKYSSYTPKLNGSWDLFSEQREVYKCYAEKTEDLEGISQNIVSFYSDTWDKIGTYEPDAQNYSFKNNVIIKTADEKNYAIYQVKSISDKTFMGEDVSQNKIHIKALFYKGNALYALIEKFYGRTHPSGTSYGIYKLHFMEEAIPVELAHTLQQKQLTEDYEALVKFAALHPNSYVNRVKEIEAAYQKRMASNK
jgi:hypothetical protein